MTRHTKQRLACIALLAVGLGLIIGGIFLPALLIAGVPIFVGGLGVLAAIVEDKDKIAFHTTINNINNYSGNGKQTVESERVAAIFNLGPSAAERINTWTNMMRDLLATAPSEMQLTGNNAPVLTFTHNYHMSGVPQIENPIFAIEDVTDECNGRDRLSSIPELEPVNDEILPITPPVSTILQI